MDLHFYVTLLSGVGSDPQLPSVPTRAGIGDRRSPANRYNGQDI
jgi:hypothetical protein